MECFTALFSFSEQELILSSSVNFLHGCPSAAWPDHAMASSSLENGLSSAPLHTELCQTELCLRKWEDEGTRDTEDDSARAMAWPREAGSR